MKGSFMFSLSNFRAIKLWSSIIPPSLSNIFGGFLKGLYMGLGTKIGLWIRA